ncbi:RnfABCDGE type electron transport complex subunit B [Alcaligenaceae bacterium]|nr:RnfABCDGE type electron transport complex subunit B [Alcaligenaceae bacterium]
MTAHSLADRLDALLPQTQCTKCGYDGCRPYAEAMAGNTAAINRCPPGGSAGVEALAALFGREPLALDPACGRAPDHLHIALIDETHCIGCTLCIQACPVDAIAGANKLMHTVLPDLCTGCELCVAPCPVDCIDMVPAGREWTRTDADAARQRHDRRRRRLERQHGEPAGPAARTLSNKAPVAAMPTGGADKKKLIADVLAKARARRQTT